LKFSIFGANGFIGSNLVNFLKNQKIEYDILKPEDQEVFEKSLGHVIYCIGITGDFRKRPFDTVESHVCLLHKILKKCKFDSFLYLSSTRIYANSSTTNEDAEIIVNPNKFEDIYNISKIMGESLCMASNKSNVRIARISNVVGNNLKTDNFLSSIIHDAVMTKKIILHSTIESEKDYVLINDVVKILPKIAIDGKYKIYNVASGKNVKNKEIIDELIKNTNCEVSFSADSNKIIFPIINVERINKEFNYEPTLILNEFIKNINEYKN
jgi:nucleoside-diphosphate-sugar epimerase